MPKLVARKALDFAKIIFLLLSLGARLSTTTTLFAFGSALFASEGKVLFIFFDLNTRPRLSANLLLEAVTP